MDKTDYVGVGETERQLANQVHYKRFEEPVFPKSIPKINEIFESLANRRFIDAGQLSYNKGLIKSQILRYVRICNNKQDVMIACRKLFAALVRRGYSERFLRKIKE